MHYKNLMTIQSIYYKIKLNKKLYLKLKINHQSMK